MTGYDSTALSPLKRVNQGCANKTHRGDTWLSPPNLFPQDDFEVV